MAETRYSIILAAALVTAGAATFGVYRVIETTKAQARALLRPVVVANIDLPEGAALDNTALTVAQWPMATVPPGAFSSADSVVGRVTRVAVFKGEAILPGRLAPSGTGPGLQVKITPGKRAMAVKIDDVAGVSGLIQPNSRVDVLVTLRDGAVNGTQVAKLFMSNMRVLAVGTVVQSGPDNRPINATTATLEVTPEEAERLAVGMREGSVQLVLRGYGDPDSISTRGARSGDVLAQLRAGATVGRPPVARATPRMPRAGRLEAEMTSPAPAAAAPTRVESLPPRPDSVAVQIYRGEKHTSQKFAKTDTTKKKPRESQDHR